MKKICVVTATRAEYGILKNTIREIHENPNLELCLVVTGSHLSSNFGNTIDEIIEDGFPIADKFNMLLDSDSPEAVSKCMGLTMISFSDILSRHYPDMLVVLGDRYEMLAVCACALNMQIPIAHISGGEVTEGAIDDCIRHCITKMSNLHFPGCEAYRQRIIQLGEQPSCVFNYGDVGVETIVRMDKIPLADLEKELGIKLDNYAIMTFHPVTTQLDEIGTQLSEVLDAIIQFPNIQFIITKANADASGKYINSILMEFVKTNANCHLFDSLGVKRYISLMANAKVIIGNSSSGIVEAPVFGVPTVNIGDRQKGRLMCQSITNCNPKEADIVQAITYAVSKEGQINAKQSEPYYKSDDTAHLIVEEIISYLNIHEKTCAKTFYDLKFPRI